MSAYGQKLQKQAFAPLKSELSSPLLTCGPHAHVRSCFSVLLPAELFCRAAASAVC
jgi:hypothetical protein